MKIDVFNNHIEISPYSKGDNPELEEIFRKWDKIRFENQYLGMYINEDILYIPRGISLNKLEKIFNCSPIIHHYKDGSTKHIHIERVDDNNDKITSIMTDFISSTNEYSNTNKYTQLGISFDNIDVILESCVNSICNIKERSLFLVPTAAYAKDISDLLISKTNVGERVCIIDRKSYKSLQDIDLLEYDIFIITYSNFYHYFELDGFNNTKEILNNMDIGCVFHINVTDYLWKVFQFDYLCNPHKTIYISDNDFLRSDFKEKDIMKESLSNLCMLSDIMTEELDAKKNINFVFYSFLEDSNVNRNFTNKYGFSLIDYTNTLILNGEGLKTLYSIMDVLDKTDGNKILCVPSKQIASDLKNIIYKDRGIVINDTLNGKFINNESPYYISSLQSFDKLGISDVRDILILTGICSSSTITRILSKMTKYDERDNIFLYYLYDRGTPDLTKYLYYIELVAKKKCKEIMKL